MCVARQKKFAYDCLICNVSSLGIFFPLGEGGFVTNCHIVTLSAQ